MKVTKKACITNLFSQIDVIYLIQSRGLLLFLPFQTRVIFLIKGKFIPSKYNQYVAMISLSYWIIIHWYLSILVNIFSSIILSLTQKLCTIFVGEYLFLCITLRLQILKHVSSNYHKFSFWNWMCEWVQVLP